jgi:hypothetical protein
MTIEDGPSRQVRRLTRQPQPAFLATVSENVWISRSLPKIAGPLEEKCSDFVKIAEDCEGCTSRQPRHLRANSDGTQDLGRLHFLSFSRCGGGASSNLIMAFASL